MRSKILGGLLLGAGLMAPTVSWSLGLGDMTVLSGPGEPFRAQIPLRSVTAEDLDALQVRLAPSSAFDSIGVQLAPGVEQLSFRIKSAGTPAVLVSSSRPLPEGNLHFLVELEWGGGKLVKDYLARMRYPESPVASPILPQPVVTVPVAPPWAMPVQRTPVASSGNQAPAAPRHASRPAPLPIGPGQQWSRVAIYGPVTGKDNLYRIASRMRSDSRLGMSQIMAALYQHNPDAFLGGNPDALRPGAVLKAPPLNLIQAMSDADAVRILTRREAGVAKPHARPAAPVNQAFTPPAKPVQSGVRTASTQAAQSTSTATKKPDFYISPTAATTPAGDASVSASVQALQEENLANKKAYELLSQTVTRLNQRVQEQQKLLLELQAQRDAALLNSPDALLKNPLMLLMVGSNALLLVLVLYLLWRQRRSSLDIAAAQVSLRSMEKEKVLQSREQNRTARQQKAESQPKTVSAPAAPVVAQAEAAPTPAKVTERVLSSTESPEVDVLDQAELYLTYGRVQQAQEALEAALTQQPGRKEIYVKLLDLYAKQSKLDEYQDLAERMRGRFGKDNPAWRGVMAQGALLFPGNPLFEDQSAAPASSPDSGFMELDLSDGNPADSMIDEKAFEESTPALEISSPERPQQEVAADGSNNIIDFDFGGLTFDASTSQAGSHDLIEADASSGDATDMNLDLLAPESGLAKVHGDIFAALDREFSALEEVVKTDSASAAISDSDEGLFLGLEDATAASAAPRSAGENDISDWDGMDTKLDLAKAYVDMGDSESARELLQEIAQQGDARVRSEAQQLLAAIG